MKNWRNIKHFKLKMFFTFIRLSICSIRDPQGTYDFICEVNNKLKYQPYKNSGTQIERVLKNAYRRIKDE